MHRDDPTFSRALDALKGPEPLKVWSLIVTIFGDLASEPGTEISGTVLTLLAEKLGVRAEALRVALHRLKKEGWIVSRRVGRKSRHQLSGQALAETREAHRWVYGPPLRPEALSLAVARPDSDAPEPSSTAATRSQRAGLTVEIAPGVTLGPSASLSASLSAPDALVIPYRTETAPPWVDDALLAPAVRSGYAALESALSQTLGDRRAFASLTRLEAVALRQMVVHRWRRLVLGHAPWIEHVHARPWRGPACRARVHGLLAQIDRPPPEDLLDENRWSSGPPPS